MEFTIASVAVLGTTSEGVLTHVWIVRESSYNKLQISRDVLDIEIRY
jgi:hypothetical protein